ncbi:MAG: polysaccharide biosynthesis/export family protein [Acidobacteria bacterium]|nr:polysaccharide biosynthesis/export family protein [Acidobacteriota bacterium]
MRTFVLTLACAFAALAQTPRIQTSESNVANLPAQRIGPNDLIAVSVYDAPELSRSVRVSADGFIRLPMLRQRLKAEGSMPSELELRLSDALQKENILVDPVVTVTMMEYHSRPISVVGAVKKPVTFQAISGISLVDAITRAEGLTPEAGPEILVSRPQTDDAGKSTVLIQRVPIKGLIDEADPELNVKLRGGEEIRVPEVGKVFVVGNVRKSGAFPVHESSGTSVLKLLALAEGLLPFSAKQAFIYRKEPGSPEKHEIVIEIQKIVDRKTKDVQLQANDILYIPDNKGKKLTANVLDRLAGFGASTASGVLVWRR